MRWSTELWDGFDKLSKYIHDGIEFYERYEEFLKERCSIENTYARSLRKLVKNYELKKQILSGASGEEQNKLSFIKCYQRTLNELRDMAGQHELIAENIDKILINKLVGYIKSLKEERKKYIEEKEKSYYMYQNSDEALRKSKSKYEASFKDAERAKDALNRVEQDDSSSRIDIRKQQQNYDSKLRVCDAQKADYANQLCEANKVKGKYFNEQLPSFINSLQSLEEKRLKQYQQLIFENVQIEREIIPRIERCLNETEEAAKSINVDADIDCVVIFYKTGYSIPDDHLFEDLGEPCGTNNSSSNGGGGGGGGTIYSNKLGNFSNSTSTNTISSTGIGGGGGGNSNGGINRAAKYKTISRLKGLLKSKSELETLADLPPQQQRKEIQKKLDAINSSIDKEQKEREGLLKLKNIYSTNQNFGDSDMATNALKQNDEKLNNLKQQLKKYQDLLNEVDQYGGVGKANKQLGGGGNSGTLPKTSTLSHSNSQTSINTNNTLVNNSIPNTPLSQHNNSSLHTNNNNNSSRQETPNRSKFSGNTSFDDSDEEAEQAAGSSVPPIVNSCGGGVGGAAASAGYDQCMPQVDQLEPSIGRAYVVYEFKGTVQNSLSISENEILEVLERDSGDGWTLVRRVNSNDKGYVPTGYVKIDFN